MQYITDGGINQAKTRKTARFRKKEGQKCVHKRKTIRRKQDFLGQKGYGKLAKMAVTQEKRFRYIIQKKKEEFFSRPAGFYANSNLAGCYVDAPSNTLSPGEGAEGGSGMRAKILHLPHCCRLFAMLSCTPFHPLNPPPREGV